MSNVWILPSEGQEAELVLPVLLAVPAFAQWPHIDTPLPKQPGGEKDAALIVSIEDYLLLPDVKGANQNGVAWYQHLTKTRGVPASSVVFLKDSEATLEGIQARGSTQRTTCALRTGAGLNLGTRVSTTAFDAPSSE